MYDSHSITVLTILASSSGSKPHKKMIVADLPISGT